MARAADARHMWRPHGLPLAAHMFDYRPTCAARQCVQPGTNLQLQGVATRAGDVVYALQRSPIKPVW